MKQIDPLDRETEFTYTDTFYPSLGSTTTYAYPTTVTDPGGFSSTIKYRYDTGANIQAASPAPVGQTYGKTSKRVYDNIGRIERESILVTGSPTEKFYTRYEYPNNNGVQRKVFSTIADVDGDGNIADDEAMTESWTDGAGRVRRVRTEHPGSTGGWSAVETEYDKLGRVYRTSVPTEVSVSGDTWTIAGTEDTTRGWVWNYQYYDWMGRTERTVPSDSNGTDGKDTLISYAGCGCAGGVVTTVLGPETSAIAVGGTSPTTGRRTQKIHQDSLGQTEKIEIWDLDGASLFSTTEYEYNGRGQVIKIREVDNTQQNSPSPYYQDTVTTYDGHGRVSTVHRPEYHPSTYMTTTYNADDTVATVTDPRGAVTSYTYGTTTDERALLTKIAYAAPTASPSPSPAIFDPEDVEFTYDDLGNRVTMEDGTGTLTYTYDSLSRLTSETKDFTDSLPAAPNGVYTLTYNYHAGGALKSITDPFGYMVHYGADKSGRITQIGNGSGAPASTKYVSSINYRAFGGVKSMNVDPAALPVEQTLSYDNALRPVEYKATSNSGTVDVQKANYTYGADGLLNQIDNIKDSNFDQANKYDFAGRLKENDVGTGTGTHPFKQTMAYDAFDNMTVRTAKTYTYDEESFTASYTNNRQQGSYSYDQAGHLIWADPPSEHGYKKWRFDASGRQWRWEEPQPNGGAVIAEETTFDGDGRAVKRKKTEYSSPCCGVWTSYFVYSSVTGQKINDLDWDGERIATHVYLNGTIIASEYDFTAFQSTDPVSGSTLGGEHGRNELAALGTSVPETEPPAVPAPNYGKGGNAWSSEFGCSTYIDGILSRSGKCTQSQLAGTSDMTISTTWRGWWVPKAHESAAKRLIRHRRPGYEELIRRELNGVPGSVSGFFVSRGSFNLVGAQTQGGTKARLSERDQQRYNTKRAEVRSRLGNISDKCRDFLEKAGLAVSNVLKAIDLQNAYDGEQSTISMNDAGYYEEGSLSDIQPEKRRDGLLNQRMADFIKKNAKAVTALFPGGKMGGTVDERSDVYFQIDYGNGFFGLGKGYGSNSGLTQTTILHEAIHSLTGLRDRELYTLLTGKTADSTESSRGISQALRDNDCTD